MQARLTLAVALRRVRPTSTAADHADAGYGGKVVGVLVLSRERHPFMTVRASTRCIDVARAASDASGRQGSAPDILDKRAGPCVRGTRIRRPGGVVEYWSLVFVGGRGCDRQRSRTYNLRQPRDESIRDHGQNLFFKVGPFLGVAAERNPRACARSVGNAADGRARNMDISPFA